MDAVLDGFDEGVVLVAEDWTVARTNDPARRFLPPDPVGTPVLDAFPESVAGTFGRRFADRQPAAESFEEFYPEPEAWLTVRTRPLDGDGPVMAVYLRDVTDRRSHEETFEERERQLAVMDRLTATVSDVVASMSDAIERETVERTLVDRLAAAEGYEAVVVLDREREGVPLAARAAAGAPEGFVGALTDETEGTLETAAIETGEPASSCELAGDEALSESIRREAFAEGLQCGLALPLIHADTVYGVLGVYTARPDAFGERERAGFEALARTAGLAIGAARRQRLLLSDTVLALTLRVDAEDDPLALASGQAGTALAVDGVVPTDDGLLCYLSIEDGAPAALEAVGLPPTREIDRDGGERRFEVTVTDGALPAVAARGATVRTATFEGGTGRIVAEVAPDVDVRAFVGDVADDAPGVELIARRERERDVETAGEFRRDLRERLTDRQYTALKTARLAGYFRSPRGSTAEEVAASLDITSPTLHHHLRAAERKLVDAFFADERMDERPSTE